MGITIKDIAKETGLSVAGVSKALNDQSDISDKTKQRVKDVARRLGYTPNLIARNLVKKDNKTIGVLIPDISTPIYPAIYKGINAKALDLGYTLLLGDTNRSRESEERYARTMVENRIAGLVVSPISNHIDHLEAIVAGQFPIIYFGGKVHESMRHFVGIDNYMGASLATRHLVELGHTSILMLSDKNETKTRLDRIEGFRTVMARHGLTAQVRICDTLKHGRECGAYMMEQIIQEGRTLPSAIFALNDPMAIGVMEVLDNHGIQVPDEISVIGYDDIAFSSLPMIGLTTIWQPKYETGAAVIEMMDEILSHPEESEPHRRILETKIIVRKSTCHV